MTRVFMRLATIWAAIVLLWALILRSNVPGVFGHGEWFPVLLVALAPLGTVTALAWAFRARK